MNNPATEILKEFEVGLKVQNRIKKAMGPITDEDKKTFAELGADE